MFGSRDDDEVDGGHTATEGERSWPTVRGKQWLGLRLGGDGARAALRHRRDQIRDEGDQAVPMVPARGDMAHWNISSKDGDIRLEAEKTIIVAVARVSWDGAMWVRSMRSLGALNSPGRCD